MKLKLTLPAGTKRMALSSLPVAAFRPATPADQLAAITDEREGLPSASSLERIALCPASFFMEKQAPVSGAATPWADGGDRCHDILAGKANSSPPLTLAEKDGIEKCRERVKMLLADLGVNAQTEPMWAIKKEHRYWLTDSTTRARILSGKADYIAYNYSARYALIVDYKTGHIESESASGNMQLRTLWRVFKMI